MSIRSGGWVKPKPFQRSFCVKSKLSEWSRENVPITLTWLWEHPGLLRIYFVFASCLLGVSLVPVTRRKHQTNTKQYPNKDLTEKSIICLVWGSLYGYNPILVEISRSLSEVERSFRTLLAQILNLHQQLAGLFRLRSGSGFCCLVIIFVAWTTLFRAWNALFSAWKVLF